ncbi:MAG: hypothetical protein V1934_06390 [Methanobacteriota archaeon]
MNVLSKMVLAIMEESPLGAMSKYVLMKQSQDANINLEEMSGDDLQVLSVKLKDVLPFFIGDQTEKVVISIRKLKENGGVGNGQD